jgi:serine/threonine protein phosphatase PrpC
MVKAKLRCAGASDPGRVRRNNEDAWHIDAARGVFLVVDGIGGHAAGETAASIAVERVRSRLERQTGTTEQRVREAIAMANNEILRTARSHPEWEGMACVLTLAVLDDDSVVIGHVGDSRLYEIRGQGIRKLTSDHSPVGEREDKRELSETDAMHHPRRNEIFRDVGSSEHAPDDPDFIELRRIRFEPDSALLLCSDGLSDQVTSAEIRSTVRRHAGNPSRSAHELIEAANRAGGKDNVSVVIVEGEQFAKSLPEPALLPEPKRGWWSSLAGIATGLALGFAAAWLSIPRPEPQIILPQLFVVGPGQTDTEVAPALARARSGDTIEVLAGEYREQVRLKDGVILRSRIPREAVLRAAPLSDRPAILAEGVKGARVTGFLVQADAQAPLSAGIVLINSEVELDDNEISGPRIGVEIRGMAIPILRANSIHDCAAEGVLILGPSTPWISHNAFRDNKGAGLAARGEARPSLIGNIFERNVLDLPPEMALDAIREKNVFMDSVLNRPPLHPRSASAEGRR